jgi:hypothetical protein
MTTPLLRDSMQLWLHGKAAAISNEKQEALPDHSSQRSMCEREELQLNDDDDDSNFSIPFTLNLVIIAIYNIPPPSSHNDVQHWFHPYVGLGRGVLIHTKTYAQSPRVSPNPKSVITPDPTYFPKNADRNAMPIHPICGM